MENRAWISDKLGSVIEIKYGKDHKKLSEGNFPCLGSGGIMRYVDSYLYDDESILIPRKGSLNNIMFQDSPFWTVDTMFWSKIDKSKVFPKYLFYQLTLIDYENLNVGSAVPSLTVPVINEIDIQLPPLPEQKAIASVLSSLDDKIDLLHQQNQTLEALAETLFRQWFIEEAKEDWEEGKLEELVLSANTGLDAIRRAPIVENYTGIKCLRIQDISQNKIFDNWGNTVVKESDFVKAQLKRGDIIMARTCSPGILLHVQEDLNAVFNNGLARIRANENSHPIFLKYLFKTNEFINHIYGISDGTAVQLNMKLGDLLSYDLKIPPINSIEKFVEIVSEWDDKILSNQQQIQTLTKLRDTLLPKLMSGEVRVKIDSN